MGDALSLQERDLLDLGDPAPGRSARLLKVGHHGSRNATDPAWIARLRPEVALICAGRRNPFGHPHPETLELLRAAGIANWTSGPCFGVRIQPAPGGWNVGTGSGEETFLPSRRTPRP
jgi:competence protein ComEC